MSASTRGTRTREKILQVASRRFRAQGLAATSVGEVMQDAGMTHGGFYLHFPSKESLEAEAFSTATGENRGRWFSGLEQTDPPRRLERLMRRYFSPAHRDGAAEGCPFASLAGEIAAGDSPALKQAYEGELNDSTSALADHVPGRTGRERTDRALAILALCVGGLLMSRAVKSPRLSNRILRACRAYVLEHAEANADISSKKKA